MDIIRKCGNACILSGDGSHEELLRIEVQYVIHRYRT